MADKEFANVLREAMTISGIRVALLARRLNKSEACIAKWRGGASVPRVIDLPRICTALGLDSDSPLAMKLYQARGVSPERVIPSINGSLPKIPDFISPAYGRAIARLVQEERTRFLKILANELLKDAEEGEPNN